MNYLSVSKQVDELKSPTSSVTAKAKAGAVLMGRGVLNLGVLLLKEGPPALVKASAEMKERIEAEKKRRDE